MADKLEITAERIAEELAAIGFADMGTYIALQDDGSAVLDWSNLPEGATKVISEITQDVAQERDGVDEEGKPEFTPVRKTKFKLYDKRAALVDLGKHLGMFPNRVEHAGTPGQPVEIIVRDVGVEGDEDGSDVPRDET